MLRSDAGTAATVNITVTVHAPKKTVVANTVSVASRTRDPEAANDSATALTEVR